LALALLVGLGGSPFGAPALAAGTLAPNVQATLSDGSAFDLAAERGHVVVLNFWASWCGPCRREAPVLTRSHQRLASRGGRVVGLSVDDVPDSPVGRAHIARAAQAFGMSFPIGLASQTTEREYRIHSVPTTFVINHAGQVTATFVGEVADAQLEQAISAALR
jgi:thiol-disulfide isomerase/thioredoxin